MSIQRLNFTEENLIGSRFEAENTLFVCECFDSGG